ncbi:MAG TPA: hypothetical protein VHC20_05520 [Candidatus Paceibacterota bacterium]|nr:hypothetical protein [Candidatus Paceibacterota bacterium]
MKTRLIILLVVLLAGAGTITVVAVRLQQQQTRERNARQKVQSATPNTNMMREIKPLAEPPIFPEKKKQ